MPNPEGTAPRRWERGAERLLASTRIFDLKEVAFRHPERKTERGFVVIDSPDWAKVAAVTPDGRLVTVRQFRYGTDAFSLELPGGIVERGEDPVAAAVRELREETGFEGARARLLASFHPNPAIQSNRCHLVLVEDAERRAEVAWDADEEIEVGAAPVAQVLAWGREGRITHSLALAALFHFEGWWREREKAR